MKFGRASGTRFLSVFTLTAIMAGATFACGDAVPGGSGGSGNPADDTDRGGDAAGGAAGGGSGSGSGSGGSDSAGGGGSTPQTASVCATAAEEETLSLTCPEGGTITTVDFASYGTSTGECGAFSAGECDAANSVSVIEAACAGQSTCSVEVTNDVFGGDPCSFVLKNLNVEVTCTGGGGGGTGGEGTGGEPTTGGTSGGGTGGGDTGGSGGGDPDACPTALVGYAAVNAEGVNGTTGGGSATPTVVTTLAQLRSAVQDSAPRVVVVSGTINTTSDGDGYPLAVASNKTIRGQNDQATIVGGLTVKNGKNVIITNLNIKGVWPGSGPGDTLSSSGSHHIWWDHLNVWDAEDGLLDITNASDFQTVSWVKFSYTNASHDHRLASLNGSGAGDHPEDWGHNRVTYHHNWFSTLVDQRMPRVMYGEGHQFNNYYNAPGNAYCIGVGSYGSILVENNYFKDVNDPILHMYDVYMYSAASGNVFDNTTGHKDTGFAGTRDACPGGDCTIQAGFEPGPFEPPYDYTLRNADDVPEIVQRCAGPQ